MRHHPPRYAGGALAVRRVSSFSDMLRSFVLRLVMPALAEGDLAGEIESVATGECVPFHDVGELLAFCQQDLASADSSRPPAANELITLPRSRGRTS